MRAFVVGEDCYEHEVPEIVSHHIEHIGFVVIGGIDFVDESGEPVEDVILETCEALGVVSPADANKQGNGLWTLDSTTSTPEATIPLHSDNPFLSCPEEIVSFWAQRSTDCGGDNIILPLDLLLVHATKTPGGNDLIRRVSECPAVFANDNISYEGTSLDLEHGKVRYDKKYLKISETHRGTFDEFDSFLVGALQVGFNIRLRQGEVLFFNNRTALHGRLPYTDTDRRNIRVRITPS